MTAALRLAPLALCVALAAGCATTVEVRGPIQPAAVPPERLPYKVAVVFPEPMGYYDQSVRVGRVFGVPQTVTFDYGDVLWDSLYRSVLAVYSNVTPSVGPPRPGQYDRVIKFVVKGPEGHGARPVLTRANVQFAISVTMEALDGASLESLQRATLQRGLAYDGDAARFDRAIEGVIRQICDDVAAQLTAGFAQ